MTEVEFIERLHQELTEHRQFWPEVQAVISHLADPSLAPNELLVYSATEPSVGPLVLRVTVESQLSSSSAP